MSDSTADRDEPRPPRRAAGPPPQAGPPVAPARRNGVGVAALVFGVVGLVLAVLLLFAPLGALLGLIAVILGIVGLMRVNQRRADNRGQAVAGLLTGALALLLGLVITVSVGSFVATHATDFNRLGHCMRNATTDQARQTCARDFADSLDRH